MNEKVERSFVVHKMTSLAIEEAIRKGKGPIEVLRWALQYGKRVNLTESEVAKYLLTPPDEFVQQCRKEGEDDNRNRGNV